MFLSANPCLYVCTFSYLLCKACATWKAILMTSKVEVFDGEDRCNTHNTRDSIEKQFLSYLKLALHKPLPFQQQLS